MIETKKRLNSKIAFIVPRLCTGGVEINFLNLSNLLIHRFSQIEIVYQSESDEGDYRSKFKEGIVFSKLGTLSGIRMINEYRKYFNSSKPSVIFVSMYVVAIYMLIAKIFSKHKPLIVINGGNHFTSFTNESLRFKEKYLLPIFARVIFKRANFFVSQCDDMSKDIIKSLKFPIDKIKTIYNPVVSEDFNCSELSRPNHPWFDAKDSPVLIMAGRLVRQKNIIEFLDVFNNLQPFLNIKLIILGEGPLHSQIEERVIELGLNNVIDILPNQKNYLSYIAYSDLMIVNSEYEGLNNMIIHALSCGTKIISTDCPVGPSEILLNGKFGKLVKVGDKAQMAKTIMQELNSPSISPDALVKRSKDFTIESSVKEFENLCKNLISDK
ncbi:glycosyltransferase [Gammaproteobacteria bacterium]|nr:glycosyltransferase [Gammaproteobacteria bacterium]